MLDGLAVDPQDGQQIWLDKDGNERIHMMKILLHMYRKTTVASVLGGFSTRFDWKGFSVNADFSFMLGKQYDRQ